MHFSCKFTAQILISTFSSSLLTDTNLKCFQRRYVRVGDTMRLFEAIVYYILISQ